MPGYSSGGSGQGLRPDKDVLLRGPGVDVSANTGANILCPSLDFTYSLGPVLIYTKQRTCEDPNRSTGDKAVAEKVSKKVCTYLSVTAWSPIKS